jgi:putative acetyltransferase
MHINLRSEMSGDEESIDRVNCSAFGSMNEANIVRLMRVYHPAFDSRYSITAWDGDTMIGHALFTPARIRLVGQTVKALALGPIAVLPEKQRKGVGGQLIRHGHELGKLDGFALVFLYGHPSYYPKHGYHACFGLSRVTIDVDRVPGPTRKFRRLPVQPDDIPWLAERHEAEWEDVDFGWLWGNSLSEWTIPCLNALMWWTEDGRRAAYTVALSGRTGCKILLADDTGIARDVVATIRPTTLEHHPSGWMARNCLDPAWATTEVKVSSAAMACELQEGVLESYLKAIDADDRLPGFTLFPLPFLAC